MCFVVVAVISDSFSLFIFFVILLVVIFLRSLVKQVANEDENVFHFRRRYIKKKHLSTAQRPINNILTHSNLYVYYLLV